MVMPRKSHRRKRPQSEGATQIIRVNQREDYQRDHISPGRLVAWAEWVPYTKPRQRQNIRGQGEMFSG